VLGETLRGLESGLSARLARAAGCLWLGTSSEVVTLEGVSIAPGVGVDVDLVAVLGEAVPHC
jgi:hypothetical protein